MVPRIEKRLLPRDTCRVLQLAVKMQVKARQKQFGA